MDRGLVYYLANPFSTPVVGNEVTMETVKQIRHHVVQYIGMQLYEMGFVLVEPIASSYYKSLNFDAPANYEYWKVRDRRLIEACDAIMICGMDGWERSVGVQDEIVYARSLGKPCFFITVKEDGKIVKIEQWRSEDL